MAAATLYSGLLMGWRSRWCWQTRMRSQARWCQWCRCRDSCRQGHPHRRPAPPSARTVPAKTASAECFLQQDLEWCPQSKALPSRQGPRARKQAHVRRSEPCCKFCHTESCTGVALKELKPKPKWSRSPTWIQTREQHTDAHVCFELGILRQTSRYLTSCGAHLFACGFSQVAAAQEAGSHHGIAMSWRVLYVVCCGTLGLWAGQKVWFFWKQQKITIILYILKTWSKLEQKMVIS